jgi:predicted enzyme related to lactoylglutathione lyase
MIPSPPLVWAELITDDVEQAVNFYGAVFGWRGSALPGTTDLVVHLDVARTAGPICGIRPRLPGDARPEGGAIDVTADRWNVRLSPPRPPRSADPAGDQLMRPRSPGPRLGRWASPSSLCFAELRTQDAEGARLWLERRLDAVLDPAEPHAETGLGTLVMQSSVDPSRNVACVVDEPDPAEVGWLPCVQVASIEQALASAHQAGVAAVRERAVPAGCLGTAAAELTDPGGARFVLIEHGPAYGRR